MKELSYSGLALTVILFGVLFIGSSIVSAQEAQLVNDLVTFEPFESTFVDIPDPTGCPSGFIGKFSFEARLTNISDNSLAGLLVEVTTLTNENLLQNADGGPGGVGATLTVPETEGFSDGELSPREFVDVPFIVCLTEKKPFGLVVDVLGAAPRCDVLCFNPPQIVIRKVKSCAICALALLPAPCLGGSAIICGVVDP
jgi:hypothetical protein